MKKGLLIVLVALTHFMVGAQIINIPDANFKQLLLDANPLLGTAKDINGNMITIDINGNDEIEESEALNVYELFVAYASITDITGVEYFQNLTNLYIEGNEISNDNFVNLTSLRVLNISENQFTNANFSNLVNLEYLNFSDNQFNSVNLSANLALKILDVSGNPLADLDVLSLTDLERVFVRNTTLTSLDVSNLPNLYDLDVIFNTNLTSLNVTGLVNLEGLECFSNNLTSLDVSTLTSLTFLRCEGNQIPTLDLTGLDLLETVMCGWNLLTELDVSMLPLLDELRCSDNQITSLDISNNPLLDLLYCSNNALTYLNCKNGNEFNTLDMEFNPDMEYICADEFELQLINHFIDDFGYTNCVANSYCSFVPGGEYFTVEGNIQYDFNDNGCDLGDPVAPNIKFEVASLLENGVFFSKSDGSYFLPITQGTHTITPQLENPNYFNVFPSTLTVNFPADPSPTLQDFCIEANGVHPDLEVVLLPILPARPGFDANYRIQYKNKGNQVQSGTITMNYEDDLMDLVSAVPTFDGQTTNEYSWNFTNLLPFESRTIDIVFNINAPTDTPPVNNGDVLNFVVTIDPTAGDETPLDNEFVLEQVVVGSFDPNDKTGLQGESILIEQVNDYMTYLIRFENTGTFPAENIVIRDTIDSSKFNVESLQIVGASHDFVARSFENIFEFVFEGIDLPSSGNNQGFVSFKIKTENLSVGDTFSNDAAIYFDYNFPIITNNFTTTIGEFVPVVANQPLNLEACDIDGVSIFDLTVTEPEILGGQNPIDHQITFHESQADANAGVNSIVNTSNYVNISNPQTIYIRLERLSDGEFATSSFSLIVNDFPEIVTVSDLVLPDENNDGMEVFDLTIKESEILNGQTNITLQYFESYENAVNNIDAISNPSAYTNSINPQEIFVRMENDLTQCLAVNSFIIFAEPTAGVEDISKETILIYPNPATSKVWVQSKLPIIEIKIQGQLGQTIFERFDNRGIDSFFVGSFPQGIYFVELSNGNTTHIKKLIIK